MSPAAELNEPLPLAVVNECKALLIREERALEPMLATLRALRSALIIGDMAAIETLLQQKAEAENRENVVAARAQFRRRVGTLLQIEESQVTVRNIANWASQEHREELLNRRNHLAALAAEVDLLGRANAALLRQSVDLLNTVLAQITGANSSDSYDPSGRVGGGVSGSIIQTDC